MEIDDAEIYAVFPFFRGAREYIKKMNISIDEILNNPYYEVGRLKGVERAKASVKKSEMSRALPRSNKDRINEIVGYVIARMIISCTKDKFIIRRFAESERYRFRAWVNTYLQDISIEEKEEFITKVCREMGLDVEGVYYGEIDEKTQKIKGYKYSIPAYQFLQHTARIKPTGQDSASPFKWKLTLRLKHGRVYVSDDELIRICEEMIKKKINSELPLNVPEEFEEIFKKEINDIKMSAENIKKRFEVSDLGKVEVESFPPCIKQILGMIQAGENVGHAARFSITAFLNVIGMNTDDILSIFHTSPDFDESKARYQIEHITGKRSSTVYIPPECKTMKSYGICYNPDNICKKDWMTHPLKYYRFKRKKKKTK